MNSVSNDIVPTLPELGLTFLPLEPADPVEVGGIRLLGRIGEGGMGRVYLGTTAAGRAMAVKVVKDPYATDPAFRARFAREAAIAGRVSGLFTAPVLGHDASAARPWLATAFIPGPSLAVAVGRHGTLPVHGVWRLAAGIAEALKAIHAAGITHRDLKPGNVLLAADGPRVIDFGISRADDDHELTQTGARMGTPNYMAPEQLRGEQSTPATDVFALGSVIAFAATGVVPFRAGSDAELLYRILHAEPALDDVTDESLRELIGHCLAKDPAARPSTQDIIDRYTKASVAAAGSGWLPAKLADTLIAIPAFEPTRSEQAQRAEDPTAQSNIADDAAAQSNIADDAAAQSNVADDPGAQSNVVAAQPAPVVRQPGESSDLAAGHVSLGHRLRSGRRWAIVAVVVVLAAALSGAYLLDRKPAAPSPESAGLPSSSTGHTGGPGVTGSSVATPSAPGPSTVASGGSTAAPVTSPGGGVPVTSPSPAKTGTSPRSLPSGPYSPSNMVIVSKLDNTVLTPTGTADGSKVLTVAWQGLSSQRWKFERVQQDQWVALVLKSLPSKQIAFGDDDLGVLKSASSGFPNWRYNQSSMQIVDNFGCLTAHGPGRQVTREFCDDDAPGQRWRVVS